MASLVSDPTVTARAPQSAGPIAAISARGIRKSYSTGDGEVEILHGVNIDVDYGQMVAVMGPSGSGKSTLLYCLAGLETPTQGGVIIAGRPLGRMSRADLAVLPADPLALDAEELGRLRPVATIVAGAGAHTG